MVRSMLVALLLVAPLAARADSFLPFGREWAGDEKLPRPYGVGVDTFTMNQDYDIERLSFQFPGITLPDPSVIKVKNRIHHEDLKLDAWILPFLNVFAFAGHVHARTYVDLSGAQAPVPLSTLPVRYAGDVFGGGVTLAYGYGNWIAALTGTYADTDLHGDFDSKVHSTTWQPRVGYKLDQWTFWGGAMYLDITEHHQGDVVLGPLGRVPFDVVLQQSNRWNPAAGARFSFSDALDLTFEVGGGERTTTLVNIGYRFE